MKRNIEGMLEGFPYKGPPIDLKNSDDIDNKLKFEQNLRVSVFKLWEQTDLEEYERVCSKVTAGEYMLSFEEREYVPEQANWVVLIRWIECWWTAEEEESKDA